MPESELELFITSLNVTYLWKKVFLGYLLVPVREAFLVLIARSNKRTRL